MKNTINKLGVDIGGVIIGRGSDEEDTSFFGSNYLLTEAIPDVFESIKKLKDADFDIYLVSKCGSSTEKKSRDWLAHRNFYAYTGVNEAKVRFCKKRADKATICDELGITHFIDDRLEVLSYLKGVQHLYLFNPDEAEMHNFESFLSRVTKVSAWHELISLLIPQSSGCASQ